MTKQRLPLHVLLMGDSGTGKDTLAATFPKPMLVWHLDGIGQDMPYMQEAQSVSDFLEYPLGNFKIQYRDIITKDGGFIRVEYYSSDDPLKPDIASVLATRMSVFQAEKNNWATLACGSLSSAALEARLYEQFVLNPQYKDPRKWYGSAAEYIERLIMMQKGLPCNTVFMCHVGMEKDEIMGELVFTPDLPGKQSRNAGRYFSEIYRTYCVRNEKGEQVYAVQTQNDGRYIAKTHIKAPNPCWPDYQSLWVNWEKG